MTWYDVLGVMPGAEGRKIKQKYDAKAALLPPELICGAPPDVVAAVRRAQELLDTAGRCSATRSAAGATTRRSACGVRAEAWASPGPASNRPD